MIWFCHFSDCLSSKFSWISISYFMLKQQFLLPEQSFLAINRWPQAFPQTWVPLLMIWEHGWERFQSFCNGQIWAWGDVVALGRCQEPGRRLSTAHSRLMIRMYLVRLPVRNWAHTWASQSLLWYDDTPFSLDVPVIASLSILRKICQNQLFWIQPPSFL